MKKFDTYYLPQSKAKEYGDYGDKIVNEGKESKFLCRQFESYERHNQIVWSFEQQGSEWVNKKIFDYH